QNFLEKVSFFSPEPPHLLQKFLRTALFLFCDAKKKKRRTQKGLKRGRGFGGGRKNFLKIFALSPDSLRVALPLT
ncbi:MAG: hypothetical protein AB7F32_08530, partial [Victivallaceae bacterium]